MHRIRRRELLPILVAPVLAACGFHPVYAPGSGGSDGAAAQGLAEISVGLIPDRPGQLLRLALQERFERAGIATARRYDLNVVFGIKSDQIAILPDITQATWVRLTGTANFTLISQDPSRATLTSGVVREVDGYNMFNQQYFDADLEQDAVQHRIAQAIADQIALRLASFFAKRAADTHS